jgi:hypothetical protein
VLDIGKRTKSQSSALLSATNRVKRGNIHAGQKSRQEDDTVPYAGRNLLSTPVDARTGRDSDAP